MSIQDSVRIGELERRVADLERIVATLITRPEEVKQVVEQKQPPLSLKVKRG